MSGPNGSGTAPGADGSGNGSAGEDRAAVRAAQEAALRRFGWFIVGSGVVLLGLGAWLGGVDFAAAVLIGILIVFINFIWTKRAVRSVLFSGQPRTLLTLSFLVKFGITGAVLYYLILRLNVNAVGILVGLSSLALASAAFALQPGRGR
jgi:ATP synthase I chain